MTKSSLTVHNAEIRTATVEIKTLTVSGKQVTLAVFRQLVNDWLVDNQGNFQGTPWGVVNYCPDKWCSAFGDGHQHVVWQDGTDLRRSVVNLQAWLKHGVFTPPEADRLVDCLVLDAITEGAAHVGETLPGVSRSYGGISSGLRVSWASGCLDGRVEGMASDEAKKAWDCHVREGRRVEMAVQHNAEIRARQSQAATVPNPDDPWPTPATPAALRSTPRDATYTEPDSVQDLRDLVEAFGATTGELSAQVVAQEQIEADRRARLVAVVKVIDALPQLFIAV